MPGGAWEQEEIPRPHPLHSQVDSAWILFWPLVHGSGGTARNSFTWMVTGLGLCSLRRIRHSILQPHGQSLQGWHCTGGGKRM